MMEYDVIVVGAGPAGCGAVKAAAERGASTILIEEHSQIGLPNHCTGRLPGTKSGIGKAILSTMNERIVITEAKVRRIFSPGGRMIEVPLKGKDVYIIDRELFDMELASHAVAAGANILLNTKVTGLVKDKGNVIGVTTNNSEMSELSGKVVIGTDGLTSRLSGISTWAGMVEGKIQPMSGFLVSLSGVTGIEPGVLELHIGAFAGWRGWVWLACHDPLTCVTTFLSWEDMDQCRRGDSVLSHRIKCAVPLQISRWSVDPSIGTPVANKVKPGIILAGAAAGYQPFLTALLSGRYAGEIAAEAAKEDNLTEEKLNAYNVLCHKFHKTPKIGVASFSGLSESEQEMVFDKMTGMNNLDFDFLNY